MALSEMAGKYDTPLYRESAFEIMRGRAVTAAAEAEEAAIAKAEEEAKAAKTAAAETPSLRDFKNARRYAGKDSTPTRRTTSSRSTQDTGGIGGAIANVVIKELKGTTGRRIVRGILGGLFKGR